MLLLLMLRLVYGIWCRSFTAAPWLSSCSCCCNCCGALWHLVPLLPCSAVAPNAAVAAAALRHSVPRCGCYPKLLLRHVAACTPLRWCCGSVWHSVPLSRPLGDAASSAAAEAARWHSVPPRGCSVAPGVVAAGRRDGVRCGCRCDCCCCAAFRTRCCSWRCTAAAALTCGARVG